MKEIREIVAAYKTATSQGQQTALATVVHLQGSAYRRPGARMLVTDEGELTGAISGGCLEGDALRKARLAMVQKKPMMVIYDTTDDDENVLGVGLGCNGIISILIEPLNVEEPDNAVGILETFLKERSKACLVTLFSLDKKAEQPGTCLLYKAQETKFCRQVETEFASTLVADAQQALVNGKSAFKNYQQNLTGFFEILQPPVSLLVFGAGNDSIPLVQMAHVLGWDTTVIDGRTNYATRRRFSVATNVLVAKPAEACNDIYIDDRTVAALMTHNFNHDIEILKQLLITQVSYIGLLGPKKKMNKMLDELALSNYDLTEKKPVLFGPSGLDIGSETAEEIALSILSEIKAVLAGANGSFLRNKNEPIHALGQTESSNNDCVPSTHKKAHA